MKASPILLATALGAGALTLFMVSRRASASPTGGASGNPELDGLSLEERYQVVITAPTSDLQFYAREVAFFRQAGRDDMAAQIQLRADQLATAALPAAAEAPAVDRGKPSLMSPEMVRARQTKQNRHLMGPQRAPVSTKGGAAAAAPIKPAAVKMPPKPTTLKRPTTSLVMPNLQTYADKETLAEYARRVGKGGGMTREQLIESTFGPKAPTNGLNEYNELKAYAFSRSSSLLDLMPSEAEYDQVATAVFKAMPTSEKWVKFTEIERQLRAARAPRVAYNAPSATGTFSDRDKLAAEAARLAAETEIAPDHIITATPTPVQATAPVAMPMGPSLAPTVYESPAPAPVAMPMGPSLAPTVYQSPAPAPASPQSLNLVKPALAPAVLSSMLKPLAPVKQPIVYGKKSIQTFMKK